MKTLQKLRSKKGFTLMEMLIVVAIIAILVAVAIPTFTNALTKAKKATDAANIRSAYAQAVLCAQLSSNPAGTNTAGVFYMQKDGTFATTYTDAYQCKTDGTKDDIGSAATSLTAGWAKNNVIILTYVAQAGNDDATCTLTVGAMPTT